MNRGPYMYVCISHSSEQRIVANTQAQFTHWKTNTNEFQFVRLTALICDRFGSERHQNAERFSIYCNGPVFMPLFILCFFFTFQNVCRFQLFVWMFEITTMKNLTKCTENGSTVFFCMALWWIGLNWIFYWPCVSRLDSKFILHSHSEYKFNN